MIIDLHTYVGNSMLGMNGSVEELLESMERNEITTSVICPVKTVDPYFEKQIFQYRKSKPIGQGLQ